MRNRMPEYIIKIRWNCGTERYVTEQISNDEVKWELGKPAHAFDYKSAAYIVNGLNLNHISGDLGGFACVVAVDKASDCINMTKEDEEFTESYHLMQLQKLKMEEKAS